MTPKIPPTQDISLIQKAQNGSTEACAILLTQYTPLIRAMAHKLKSPDMTQQETNDMIEEGRSAFLKALSTYQTSQEQVSLGLYAKRCIRNRYISFLRRRNTQKKRDAAVEHPPKQADNLTPSALLVSDMQGKSHSKMLQSLLTPLEFKVYYMRFDMQMKPKDIATSLQVDAKTVYNAICRIKIKVKSLHQEGI